jgi:hypothetical protein
VEEDDDDDDDDDDDAAAAADDEIEPVDADAEKVAVVVEPSLALVTVDVATVALADGVYSRSFEGNGTVVHHDPKSGLGLVLVDRNTVPVASCDVLVSFAAYPHEVGAFCTLVPIRPRWRGERRSLRIFAGTSLRPHLAFNPDTPRRLSTPTDAFELHPDVASYGTTLSRQGGVLTPDA